MEGTVKFIINGLEALNKTSYTEAMMIGAICDIVTLVGKYEEKWEHSGDISTRDSLVGLIKVFGALTSFKVHIRVGTLVAAMLVKNQVTFSRALWNIQVPLASRAARRAEMRAEIIRDRNLFKNRFKDLLAQIAEMQSDKGIVKELQDLAATYNTNAGQMFADLNALNRTVAEQNVEHGLPVLMDDEEGEEDEEEEEEESDG